MAVSYDRAQIRAAMELQDPAISGYLDLESGTVVQIIEGDASPAQEVLRAQVMAGYGDRYRFIAGGQATADDTAIDTWLENEGL
jgi:hypothetical protein